MASERCAISVPDLPPKNMYADRHINRSPSARKGSVMPYVNISLTRGKSREYLQGVSDSVHQAIRRASCLLLPSRREGYGLVILEASAVGTPSIVVRAPDNAAVELIEESHKRGIRMISPIGIRWRIMMDSITVAMP